MYRLFLTFILSVTGFNMFSQYRWKCEDNGFSVVFPIPFRDTVIQINNVLVSKAWADDQCGNHFVAECKKIATTIPVEIYKKEWKKYHDEVLRDFILANHLEKTEEERFDIGKFHGINAILNHKTKKMTYFYKIIIINSRIITIYNIQPRDKLNFKMAKRFLRSAKYNVALLK